MTISLYSMSVESFVSMLKNLSNLLDKGVKHAEAKKFDPSVLLQSRLAPDMHPLLRQVQIACDAAKNCVPRLAGQDPIKIEDNEKTIDELKARIAKTIDYLNSFDASAINGNEARELKIPAGPDRTLEFNGLDYLRFFALPNFYFHVTTTYAILRHNGVELGKRDYLSRSR
jgi:hypothetical protein